MSHAQKKEVISRRIDEHNGNQISIAIQNALKCLRIHCSWQLSSSGPGPGLHSRRGLQAGLGDGQVRTGSDLDEFTAQI